MSSSKSTRSFEAIGTHWIIDVPGPGLTTELIENVMSQIERYDKTFSRFREDSMVTKMAQSIGAHTLPDYADELVATYQSLYRLSQGAFTPLIGQILSDVGYDASYSLMQKNDPVPPKSWEQAFHYNAQTHAIHIKVPSLLDFGAGGKGHLVDLVSQIIESYGVDEYTVDAGSDMRHRQNDQASGLRVGLENPLDTTKVLGVFTLSNGSFCASAGNRRAWGDRHHIINPHTLKSESRILATWVSAPTTLIADAIATCLFFTPAPILAKEFEFEYAMLTNGGAMEHSAHFDAELFVE